MIASVSDEGQTGISTERDRSMKDPRSGKHAAHTNRATKYLTVQFRCRKEERLEESRAWQRTITPLWLLLSQNINAAS